MKQTTRGENDLLSFTRPKPVYYKNKKRELNSKKAITLSRLGGS